jgi:Tol biopolymer transport system component
VLDSSVNAVYVPSGFLVHQRGDTLLAQSFDADEERVTGEPVLLATGLGYHLFAVSAAGHVAFLNSAGAYGSADLAWYDRSGKRGETVADPDDTGTPCLSRDGRKLLVRRRDFAKSETDLWCVDLDRGGKQRLTVNAYPEPGACWSPDGRRVAFAAVKGGGHVLTVRAVDGSAPDVALVAGAKSVFDWSPDGEWISFAVSDPGVDGQGRELARSRFVRADGVSSEPVREIASCGEARFSPDGRHVAYENLESGQTEVCVCSFPTLSGRQQISTNGGVHPVWSADGRELFYGAPDNELVSVAVTDRNGDLHADVPQALFSPRDVSSGFCVSPDGKRFLFRDQREADATPLTVILNATSLMRR